MKGFNSFSCANRYQVPTAAITPYQIRQMLEMNLLNLPLCLAEKASTVQIILFYLFPSIYVYFPENTLCKVTITIICSECKSKTT